MTRTPARRPPAGRARLYRMHAQQALAAIPAGSISVLLTDPAYTSVNRRGGSGAHLQHWFDGSLTWAEIGRLLALARRKLRPDGVAFVMVNGEGLHDALGALQRADFARVRTITWDRTYPGLGGGLRHQTEFILVGLLPGSRSLSGVDLVSVPAVGPGTAGRYPTQKPDALGRELARMANIGPGDVVLDPFVGSGALLIGARERGAHVLGCDIAPLAIRQATARLSTAVTARPARSSSRPAKRTGRPRPAPKRQPRRGA